MTKTMVFIKQNTQKQNISQAYLANKLGVTEVTISRWFNGTRNPQIQYVEKMFEILGYQLNVIKAKEEKVEMNDNENPKTFLRIVVNGTKEKPYYEIEYLDKDGNLHTGYSSYDLNNVWDWKETEFEYYK